MARTKKVFEESAAAKKGTQEDKKEEDTAQQQAAAKKLAEEQARKRAIDEKKEEDKNLDDEVLSASDEGELPDLCEADGKPIAQAPAAEQSLSDPPAPKPEEPKEKNIDYSKFDEIEDSDDEKIEKTEKRAKDKADAEDEDGEETGLKSAKNPFPDELEAAELNLKASHGLGVEAATAGVSYAEVLLASAKYDEAFKFASEARKTFQEREGLETQCMGEAGAVRLMVKVLLEQEKLMDALKLAKDHLQDFSKMGNEKAAAVATLALADVHLAMDRPNEALKAAKLALDTFKKLQDNIWVAKVLQTTAQVNMKKGTPSCLKTAMQEAEEGMNYFSIVGDTKEEAATLLTISKTHLLRQEFQEAFSKADKSASLCRDAGYKKGEAAALREVTGALVALHEEHEVALQAAMEALELSDEIGDPLGEISARQLLANIYVQSNVSEMAVQSLGIGLEAARILGERRMIARVLEQVVQVHVSSGNPDKALAAVQKEAKLAGAAGDPRRQLAAFQTLATLQAGMGNQEEASSTAAEAVKYAGESEDKKVEAWALQLVAEVQAGAEKFEEALAETEKARTLLKEMGDVKEVAGTWGLTCNIQMQMNNSQGALASKTELRNTYKEAGWRDEEAAELLNIADVHRGVRGPREAVKTAKEAVTLYQELEDKVGEANAMLALANYQADGRSFTDALSTMRAARRLFQGVGDVNGEVSVLHNEGRVYFENGRSDEAVKVITEGRELCQREGEKRAEANCLQTIASMRVEEVRKEALTGRKPSPKPLEDAVNNMSELLELFRQLGDLEGQVEALIQLSGIHAMNKDETCVELAQEALQIAIKLDQANRVGTALLALAEAQQSQDNDKDAIEAAREAANQFQGAGDQQSYEMAMQIAEAAKQNMERPKTAAPVPGAGASPLENRGLSDRLRSANSRVPQPAANRSEASPLTQKKTFAFNQSQLGEKPYGTPNQDLRRQQLNAASEAHAAPPSLRPDDAAPGAGLRDVLQSVRPDWTAKDLHSVQEKLAKINVSTASELFRLLRSQGAGGVNKMLKNAGQKILKLETLQALQARANE